MHLLAIPEHKTKCTVRKLKYKIYKQRFVYSVQVQRIRDVPTYQIPHSSYIIY
jgi:hypothetical protein